MEKLNSKTFGSALSSQTKSTQEINYVRLTNILTERIDSIEDIECI